MPDRWFGRFEIRYITGQSFIVEDFGTVDSAIALWRVLRAEPNGAGLPRDSTRVNYQASTHWGSETPIDAGQERSLKP